MRISPRLMVIAALFVTCLIAANIIAVKLISVGSNIVLPAAIIIFPLSYIIGDILTEVYGFAWARRVIWLGFLCNFIFVFFAWIGGLLPGASFWQGQSAYETILGYTPRLLLASFSGYLLGSFANAAVLSRMKIWTKGRYLWTRTMGSTIVGEGLDSAAFITVAFIGTPAFALMLIVYHWAAKTLIEAVATPVTYAVVNYLKRVEKTDSFDRGVNFNPFKLADAKP
ncbi:queuosine precursor transporter [Dehalogenimonas etheniformans]|uniref:Probable queuosine precursor transporter n=1 Tax=Dehalogenimonas etheniformans TaxID=1536648 RepID=A0A2P5P5C2_9CHLR|nr:queuosine precursor transporter [Dehalogenimonas etheniformans]PPD57493.1 transporter [Dehalogenimonas etheniformans]QNT76855.1 queuosine precursor transporter [Dehalogenimonas etheniformans]